MKKSTQNMHPLGKANVHFLAKIQNVRTVAILNPWTKNGGQVKMDSQYNARDLPAC